MSSPGNLLLNGDFNFHVNDPSDSTASQFLDLLNCFNLDVFNLCTPTHKHNYVLDLIITRSGETSISNLSVHDPVISDHFAVHCSLAIKKPRNAKLTVMTRKLRNIDSDSLCTDIQILFSIITIIALYIQLKVTAKHVSHNYSPSSQESR